MKNIKLKSLLKEDESKAKAMWNRLDPDSREDVLLRFVKDPKQADAMVTMMWDRLPNAISGNKDFQNDVTYLFSKKSPTYTLTEKEDQKELKETNIKLDDQGYAASYYNVSSDVITTWNNTKIITQDIKGYLAAAHETGGPKLVKEVMNAIIAGVDQSKPLLRQLKGTSPADVDLAENETIKLTSFLKEEKHIPFKFGNLDMFVGQQGKYIYVFPKSMRQFDDFMLTPGALSVPEAIESMLDKKGIEVTKVSAPSNVPGFAFVSKASLEDIATALGAKGVMNAPTVYGEKEAIKMIWDDPGNKIESVLKKIRGYESTVQGEPRGRVLYIYFTDEQAAKKGAKVLSQLVPGPQYDKNIKSEDYGGVKTEWYIEIKA